MALLSALSVVVVINDGAENRGGMQWIFYNVLDTEIKKGMPALIGSVASSTDVNSGGAHGTTFSFKSYQNGPAPSYSGVIPTAESLPTGV
jgi:hypothetical protein